jgi:hypothetical protein
MTKLRGTLATVAALTVGGLLVSATPLAASARTADERCQGRGPIAASGLGRGAAAPGCSLVGRVVTDGQIFVVVPPAGMSVAGEGVGRHGESRGLQVTNTGTTVRAVSSAGSGTAHGAAAQTTRAARAASACRDRTFHLEGHSWRSSLRYRVNLHKMPARYSRSTVITQIRAANRNMRTGRNTCGKARLKTPASHYLGRTSARPNIDSTSTAVGCGNVNAKNVVGFGNLPGGLLGWTCYWWFGNGRMGAADIMIDTSKALATRLPASCSRTWDFEGIVTHEWGHAYGLGHTGSGHPNLTMQHTAQPCSPYARTLGLGDWLGMKKMYGAR